MNTPLINGQAFDWVGITFGFLGNQNVKGVSAIAYKKKQEKVNNYAAGSEPSTRGRGKVEYEASIDLEEVEIRRILNALPVGQSLLNVPPFTIAVSHMVGTKTYTDRLLMVEFTEDGLGVKEGDTNIVRSIPLIIAGIEAGK